MADTQTAPVADGANKRPEKPDEAKYKSDLAKAEKDHEAAQARFNAIRAKLDGARPGKSTPANDRFKELVDDQKSIRQKQQEHKSAKAGQQDKFNQNDALIKKLIGEQKDARSRVGFKNAEEIDAKIDSLQKQVDAGTMKLVDEKKALTEVSNLRRTKKGFVGLDDLQKKIDEKKAENAELKKTFDNPESRALSQKYEDNQKELDDIKAAREDTNKNFDTLKAERDKFYEEQQATYQAIRKVKDDYYAQRKAYKEFEDLIWQQKRERQKAEKDSYEKEKRKRIAEQKLEEASEPAFLDQIRTAEGLIRHFDPSFGTDEGDKGPGQFAATASRTIDEGGFKGMKVVKKEDEDFFVGGGGKKKGKGKKGGAAPAESGKLNMNIGIIEELAKVGVDPPSTQADVPGVVEKLKEKLEAWKKDQDAQTQKNIEKAKKEIEKLEQEADAPNAASSSAPAGRQNRAKKVSAKDALVNGPVSAESEQTQEKDGVADATKELAEAKIEDKEGPPVETA
ncbi:multicopy suppressor of BFA (Brefeldin A) [Cladophialophora chaetospira]|uniref:Multicopy suppressor of BFA (Brefeldin A) n=1 Tax=Cladophialophora chaetospira TaxID=386627 RepID=A0AA38XC54_9EURO|nr:multicopy suppressor of BFA (Brefeldin A) [Cladophialophora chaetospira]